ncbi:30S ribosomal protein S9 [Aureliella helgolandensis]|uniref:Small ribosomal subunit protein uS9 n=1 Tax=Aureliella helgolandensis TaxID=2527968 RepID=A0A518G6F2_9BACT|nr:30S ribosomal protein S9 [Aureliella helgolandensis]QDV24144.1 30S ribosomal protein S9 [Aureliella helgolandensis]
MVAVKKDKINGDFLGTGRRKSAVARVRVRPGTGKITVNGKPLEEFFPTAQHQTAVTQTLAHVNETSSVDVVARVTGGGLTGQSGAVRMALARALCGVNEEHFQPLRDDGFLTRDSRMKERKKPGLHGARRGTQFSKR